MECLQLAAYDIISLRITTIFRRQTVTAPKRRNDMSESENNIERPERAIIAAIDTGEYDVEASLSELRALCDTAGAEVVCEVVQNRERPDSKYYFGEGKVFEMKELAKRLDADILIVDDELSAAKARNIERIIEIDVVDRTTLILDIFARHAVTAEGKLQVELAQYRNRLLHIMGEGLVLSRLGAGIGTRGPGESKLETDRRHIRSRIETLRKRLDELEERRALTRERRKKGNIPVVALVGYTNVGKSSLLNAMTGSEVLAQDKLFATLDPTVRRLSVGDLQQVVMIDTVGFVSRLPHTLVDAFKSTLEEMAGADLILKVTDASTDEWQHQLQVADEIIDEMKCADIPQITVFNKCDMIDTYAALPGIAVSAKTGFGLDKLCQTISSKLSERVIRCRLLIPFDKLSLLPLIREKGNVISEEYTDRGLNIEVTIDRTVYNRILEYDIDRQK